MNPDDQALNALLVSVFAIGLSVLVVCVFLGWILNLGFSRENTISRKSSDKEKKRLAKAFAELGLSADPDC